MNLEKGRILPGRLLLKEVIESEKTESGLIFKPVAVVKQKTHVGQVVLVGEPLPTLKHGIVEGDFILHSPNSFTNVTIDGVELRLMDAQQALFIYK
jgi:co-chaperonin GroES (HSP10)